SKEQRPELVGVQGEASRIVVGHEAIVANRGLGGNLRGDTTEPVTALHAPGGFRQLASVG
ncbi:MAG TPA: hypothetical protein VNR62_03305, partial [Cellulomonas sp.]|nr:hypothetical protein [Cellulomonas sp.]